MISDTAAHTAESFSLIKLSRLISQLCNVSAKPVILFIDEADQAGNNKSFLEFLGLLRDKYLKRRERPTFWSVILASVYDIKNLKLKLRPQEDHQYNSPWNIAADFDIDMNFTRTDIEGMLISYENDYHTGMDIRLMAGLMYDYTSGYPFLVSRLCKIIDEKICEKDTFPDKSSAWSKDGFQEALRVLLYELLYEGQTFLYNTDDNVLDIAEMFGYIRNDNGKVMVANRIFETRLYNLFISEERMRIVLRNNTYSKAAHIPMA